MHYSKTISVLTSLLHVGESNESPNPNMQYVSLSVLMCVTCTARESKYPFIHFSKKYCGTTKYNQSKKLSDPFLLDADLCRDTAAALAGCSCTVAAVYTIALFDQNP